MPSTLSRLLTLAALVIAAPATAGVVFDIETNDVRPSRTYSSKVFAQGRQLKMTVVSEIDSGQAAAGTMIYDAKRGEMIVVDDANKSYIVIDEKAVHSIAEQVKEARAKTERTMKNMESMLGDLPEEQREMVEKMMKERMQAQAQIIPDANEESAPQLRKTGERKAHNGHQTTRFDVYRADEKLRELWVADWDEIDGGAEVSAIFDDMVAFMKKLMSSFANQSGLPGMAPGTMGGTMFEHMTELGGFPVLMREFDGKTLTSESTLRGSQRLTIDAAAFKPPADYERRSMLGGEPVQSR